MPRSRFPCCVTADHWIIKCDFAPNMQLRTGIAAISVVGHCGSTNNADQSATFAIDRHSLVMVTVQMECVSAYRYAAQLQQ
ncbi:hypothetical protein GDO86_012107 [Hymenochirus boettgeri]|uniref:Uncharacterized protein n=1 Tax=Hymenochirus boettgeri TaxID=247094 RepID=A0A8T2JGX5_9PIPI|nr:hypothetical protein GDO86_012107 [Hymenochirus boettgeri]